MAIILHIDTSTPTGMVALTHSKKLLAKRVNEKERDHAGVINIHIEEVLHDAGKTLADLDAVAVIGGPGSYTGLRIGLATAKGLCYALQKPLLMHNRLDLMCMQLAGAHPVYDYYISLLPARQREFFIAIYKGNQCAYPAQHIHQEELEALLRSLNGSRVLSGHADFELPSSVTYMPANNFDEAIWYEKADEDFQLKHFADLAAATPFYLKSAYTTPPKS